nr:hypothetical protein [Tanacetum cinerariifolium]
MNSPLSSTSSSTLVGAGCSFLKFLLLHWSNAISISCPVFMVIKGEVLNDFPRLIGILIVEFAADGAVNFALKMKGDMIEILCDVVGTSGYRYEVLRSFSWKELSKESGKRLGRLDQGLPEF